MASEENTSSEEKSLYEKKYDRWFFDIRRGRYPMRALLDRSMRVRVEGALIEEYKAGTLPDTGLKALIDYQLTCIQINKRTIDQVPEELREIVKEKIEAGETVNINGPT